MSTTQSNPVWCKAYKYGLGILLIAQFAIAYVIGTQELLANTGLSIVPPIGVTAATPVALFLISYGISERFRRFVLAQDIRILTVLQLWRIIGFVFLALYSYSILPALFAWPAGAGDVLTGIAAAFVVVQMDRDPQYVLTSGYRWFHAFGLLDFVVALGTAGLASGAFPGLISSGLTSAPMDIWPLNLFPSFIVPGFIILQLAALLKVRDMRRQHRHAQSNLAFAN
jgi:hypothetical protein